MTCNVEGCNRKIHSKGLCGVHYMREYNIKNGLIGNKNKLKKAVIAVRPEIYIAGEQFNYSWKPAEVRQLISGYIELRETGADDLETILTLSHWMKRRDADVAILIMDLAEKGYIAKTGKGDNPFKFSMNNIRGAERG